MQERDNENEWGYYSNDLIRSADLSQWTGSSLVQVIAFRLFGANPLLKPILAHCQLDSWEQKHSVKFESNSTIFIKENTFENVVCKNGGHFVQGRWVKIKRFHNTKRTRRDTCKIFSILYFLDPSSIGGFIVALYHISQKNQSGLTPNGFRMKNMKLIHSRKYI